MDWMQLIENVVVALRARGDDTIDGHATIRGSRLHELADELEEALREARGESPEPWKGYFSPDDERDGGHSER